MFKELIDQLVGVLVGEIVEARLVNMLLPFKDQLSLYNLSTCPDTEGLSSYLGLRNTLSEDRF